MAAFTSGFLFLWLYLGLLVSSMATWIQDDAGDQHPQGRELLDRVRVARSRGKKSPKGRMMMMMRKSEKASSSLSNSPTLRPTRRPSPTITFPGPGTGGGASPSPSSEPSSSPSESPRPSSEPSSSPSESPRPSSEPSSSPSRSPSPSSSPSLSPSLPPSRSPSPSSSPQSSFPTLPGQCDPSYPVGECGPCAEAPICPQGGKTWCEIANIGGFFCCVECPGPEGSQVCADPSCS